MPATRTQMWLARGAILVCIIMIMMLKTISFGSVKSVPSGDVTRYDSSAMGSVFFGVLAVLTCVLAFVFWLQPGRLFTVFSVVLLLLAVFLLFNVPTGLNHYLTVTPESFEMRIGAWYAPIVYQVDFANIQYLQVTESASERVGKRKRYELQCFTKPNGDKVIVPINDFMKKALPEIFRRAASYGIIIGESADGWQIPQEIYAD